MRRLPARRCASASIVLAIVVLVVLLLALSGSGHAAERATVGVALERFTPARTVRVKSLRALRRALEEARPGDLISVAPGTYKTREPLLVTARGRPGRPIVIRAVPRGRAKIAGRAGFELRDAAHVAIEGFRFVHRDEGPAFRARGSHHIRFTRNVVRLKETPEARPQARRLHWLAIDGAGSHHNRIDHNLVEGKSNGGAMISTTGSPDGTSRLSTRNDRIDHNHFRDFARGKGKNGYETIRLGASSLAHSSGYTVIERNLFENVDGEVEIISVKTRDNVIRSNTFVDSRGYLTLRDTHRCVVDGNVFLNRSGKPDVGGVRVYGSGHLIVNNYFEGLTGAAFTVPSGDVEARSRARHKYGEDERYGHYQRPAQVVIAHNTIVDSALAFDIGTKRKRNRLPPANVTVASNLTRLGAGARLLRVRSEPRAWQWLGNLFHRAGEPVEPSPGAGLAAFDSSDPALERRGALWRPTVASPLTGEICLRFPGAERDLDRQPRPAVGCDIGADQRSGGASRRVVLRPKDVGPKSR